MVSFRIMVGVQFHSVSGLELRVALGLGVGFGMGPELG